MTPEEARTIAKDVYIYGFPLVDSYRVQHAYFVDQDNPEYKGDWNQVHNTARTYTPADTAIQTPNADTPYSALGADLRTQPLVLTVPAIDQGRYYSLQFVDGYTYNFAYVGSRTTGNGAGRYLLAGPDWQGAKPEGIDEVIHCDTELAFVLYRTQLISADDLENVKEIQNGYQVQPLSAYLGHPAPPCAPPIDFVRPLTSDQQKTSPEFFDILDFVLRFAPAPPAEQRLREKFATLHIGAGGTFDSKLLTPEIRSAIEDGMADAWAEFNTVKTEKFDTGQLGSADVFGTAESLQGNYLYRMIAAALGIYGNTAAEAVYPYLSSDSTGAPLTGAHDYTVRFPPGQLPPVNAFWSLTMYGMPQSLLVANPIDRYLINSAMLPDLDQDRDGGYSLLVAHQSPGPGRETNWLPAPPGPFVMVLRLYWPKAEALNGTWEAPRPINMQDTHERQPR